MDDSILLLILHVPFCSKQLKDSVGDKVPEISLLQHKLMCSYTKNTLQNKMNRCEMESSHTAAGPVTRVRQHCNKDLAVNLNAQLEDPLHPELLQHLPFFLCHNALTVIK